METHKKITVTGVLSEGIGLGIKNAVSMLGATVLWLLTIWIPYLNVGTTIAMNTIPIELSKGKVISPLFIFDGKYRKYMGEYFTLIGLMYLAIIPALFFMIIPGIIISIGWSLAIYILLDKGVAPGEAMIQSHLRLQMDYLRRIIPVGTGFLCPYDDYLQHSKRRICNAPSLHHRHCIHCGSTWMYRCHLPQPDGRSTAGSNGNCGRSINSY